ncbi:hypothetical protein ACFUEJ_10680 [Gordonia sp. NPDC057258]|uniref:hypothetical protein n=1 Tax=unclassified Gordonia (in: high G+C Gram-positive bacteria) TaxID=2657482 RepID=UPI00364429B1
MSDFSKRLLTSRWMWLWVGALAIFLAGLAFGAGGATSGGEQDCGPASSAVTEPVRQ